MALDTEFLWDSVGGGVAQTDKNNKTQMVEAKINDKMASHVLTFFFGVPRKTVLRSTYKQCGRSVIHSPRGDFEAYANVTWPKN